jgi:hypothetical protein
MYTQKDYKKLISNPNKKYISENLEEFTSNIDFENYFGSKIDGHIIKYSDLKDYRYITCLLKYDKDFKIMLYEQEKNSGHWVALLRYGNTIEYFDSYGNPPNFPLSYSTEMNDSLDQHPEYLNNLLLNQNKFKVIYNTYKFQSEKNNSGTCGKYVTLRLIKLKYGNMNLTKFINFFKKLKTKYKLTNDQLITLLIPVGDN